MAISEELEKKVGPLPLWVWLALGAGVIGGGIWLWRSGTLSGVGASNSNPYASGGGGSDLGASPQMPIYTSIVPPPGQPTPATPSTPPPAAPTPKPAPPPSGVWMPLPAPANGAAPGPGQLTQGNTLRLPTAAGPGSQVIGGPGVPNLPDVTGIPVAATPGPGGFLPPASTGAQGPGSQNGPAVRPNPLPAVSPTTIDRGSIGQPA